MTNTELNEATFVLAGYAIFVWFYYKFAKKMITKEEDKYLQVCKAYVCMMCAMPTGFVVIGVLTSLYSTIFGG